MLSILARFPGRRRNADLPIRLLLSPCLPVRRRMEHGPKSVKYMTWEVTSVAGADGWVASGVEQRKAT